MKPHKHDIPIDIFKRYKIAFKELLMPNHFRVLSFRSEDKMTLDDIGYHMDLSPDEIEQMLREAYTILEKTGYIGNRMVQK